MSVSGIEPDTIQTPMPMAMNSGDFDQYPSQAMQSVVDAMPNGVVVVDGSGIVRHANAEAARLLGEPLVGELWRTIIARSFQPRADDGHEVSLHNGRRVNLSISPLKDQPGQLIALTDLTETRLLQERVGHMQRLSSLGKMVASLAHQIRTPLSSAMLYAANLSNPTLKEVSREQFGHKLQARLQDLEQQVNDMLLFAKSGEGQQVVEELSLSQLMTEVQNGAAGLLEHSDAELSIELPDPDVLILGNKTALAGALHNLLHNALQLNTPNLTIELSAKVDISNPAQVLIDVADNGPGIPKTKQTKIFEPFFTTKSQGTGLGLAVVKSVANSHQGQVSLTSAPGKGTRFTLCLPVHKLSTQNTTPSTFSSSALRSHG